MINRKKLKLGEILLKEGLVKDQDLDLALKKQAISHKRLGEVLIEEGIVSENDIATALSKQLDIPLLTRKAGRIVPQDGQELEKLIPEDFSRRHLMVPISKDGSFLTVALFDPLDLILVDNVESMTKCKVKIVIATKSDIEAAIDGFYGKADQFEKFVKNMKEVEVESSNVREEKLDLNDVLLKAEEAPVIKLVNMLIVQGIKDRASDIHIEPYDKKLRVRYRIDGILYDAQAPGWTLYYPVLSRIKILARMDISEKRLPQDGSFHIKLDNRVIDIRVSTIPTMYGEKIVLRLLDKDTSLFKLEELGFEQSDFESFKSNITRPYGLVLLTGPTGSGKTTTLYAALNYVKSPQKNILTIEDPVEYTIDGINQVEVKPSIGFTFAVGLRHALRQDPDIIMLGETRDLETAEICVRSALTGHLVLSTLHTNDAITAIDRLIDIGVAPFLVASSLNMVIAQRLVRRLCPRCKQQRELKEKTIKNVDVSSLGNVYEPRGCQYCRFTGYLGRIAVYEVVALTDEIKRGIVAKKSSNELRKMIQFRTLVDAALAKVKEGVTSLEEAFTITVGEY